MFIAAAILALALIVFALFGVSVEYRAQVTATETLATNVPAATSPTITHNGYNGSASLTAATTPPVTTMAAFSKALAAGVGTIDLTALSGTNGATVNGTGLKVQVAKFKNPVANANNITIVEGATNGYALWGAAFSVVLAPGQEITFYGNDATPDISGTDKTIDLSGTLTQALECMIIMG